MPNWLDDSAGKLPVSMKFGEVNDSGFDFKRSWPLSGSPCRILSPMCSSVPALSGINGTQPVRNTNLVIVAGEALAFGQPVGEPAQIPEQVVVLHGAQPFDAIGQERDGCIGEGMSLHRPAIDIRPLLC